ncbi:hypothetical protein WDV85_06870 [Pseudokineococcus sp. 5B2Z-1]|uniref:hypothetical protein n=1 Tax=Pseudokineococcus sp. 5B2Z-1 TaxID=3132744 RepID=UPI0030B4CEE8
MAISRASRASRTSPAPRAPRDPWAAASLDDLDCAVCGRSVPHELLECLDGHGDECPDRVCTACGAVLVVGPSPLALRRTA